MDVRLPDGTVIQNVPDGTTKAQLVAKLHANGHDVSGLVDAGSDASTPGMVKSGLAALGHGFGKVALNAENYVGKGFNAIGLDGVGGALTSDAQAGLKNIDAQFQPYKDAHPTVATVGDVGGEVVATLPVGGVLGKVVSKISEIPAALANLVNRVPGGSGLGQAISKIPQIPGMGALGDSIASGGFNIGMPAATSFAGKVGQLGLRTAGGAINGGVTAGLADPSNVGAGAVIGGALPGGAKVAGIAGNALSDLAQSASAKLMQSAIKPTIGQLRDGSAKTAVDTLLQYGISPTKAGVNKLRDLIDGLNTEIADRIAASPATVSKQNVLGKLSDVRGQFSNQVSPTADLQAIQNVADDFAAHPNLPAGDAIPVQQAQSMKQGTYQVLAKKYGQIGSAETEAQKGLARGLKDEIAAAVPGVDGLNAQESRLLTTLSVAERRALMELNKNPVGLTALAHNPLAAAGFMADRSAAFKALAARLINNAAVPGATFAGQRIINAASNPLLRATGLVSTEANP